MPAIERRAQDGALEDSPNTISNPIYIAGICIIIIVVLVVVGWLVRRYFLRRRASKDVGFLSVKGLVSENRQTLPEKDSMQCVFLLKFEYQSDDTNFLIHRQHTGGRFLEKGPRRHYTHA